MANPTLLTRPLCENADKNTIPPTDAGTSGLFSEEYGWQNINSLPLASGGKAPNRRDFNGVFALLGGIAYACQRGQSFEWVNILPYLKGCVVTDPLDGNKYNAKNDVAKGGSNPSLDPTNWERFADTSAMLTREITPAFNTRDIITTSGTYTAPVTGWYKITVKGGGGGGNSSTAGSNSQYYGGAGGGEGGTTIAYEHITANDIVTVVIGGGGATGTDGGDSSVTVNSNTYTGGGGHKGNFTNGGAGGTGTIYGATGGSGGTQTTAYNEPGGNGGGNGGGQSGGSGYLPTAGVQGGGGGGAGSVDAAGAAGGDGYVWFEYFAAV